MNRKFVLFPLLILFVFSVYPMEYNSSQDAPHNIEQANEAQSNIEKKKGEKPTITKSWRKLISLKWKKLSKYDAWNIFSSSAAVVIGIYVIALLENDNNQPMQNPDINRPHSNPTSPGFSTAINLVYIGNLNPNKFDQNSVNNPYGTYGNPYSQLSIHNQFGRYGNPFSNYSATNPYATCPPKLYDQNGVYMGKLSANKFDLDSISNPCSIYANRVKYTVTVISIYGE